MRASPSPGRAAAIERACLDAIQNRPLVDAHDLAQATELTKLCRGWMRAVYRHLETRPDLARQVARVGESLTVLENRLVEEAKR